VLAQANWSFAIRTVELAPSAGSVDWPIALGRNAFPLPADMARFVEIVDPELDDQDDSYSIEGGPTEPSCYATETGPITVRYVRTGADLEDPLKWPANFVEAFTWRLAWQIAEPLSADKGRKDRALQSFRRSDPRGQARQQPDEGPQGRFRDAVVGRPPLLDRARARNVKGRAPIYSFNGGEISRRMEGRSDLDGIYDRAVAQMLNFVATVEGPALKRSGFRYIEPEDPTAAWVSRFVFNVTQSYLFVWLDDGDGGGKVRFYTNGGRIELVPGVPYELPVPYTAAEAKELSIKQSYDRLYIAHPNHPPGMITRTGAETFTYLPIPLENGPFQDVNTVKSATVTWSGDPEVNGAGATIVCTTEIFDAGMIGSPFMFEVEAFPISGVATASSHRHAQHRRQAPERRQGLRVRRKGRDRRLRIYRNDRADAYQRQRMGRLATDHRRHRERRRRRSVEISL
jgi:hypothetical protein